jgi:hypothetical protein
VNCMMVNLSCLSRGRLVNGGGDSSTEGETRVSFETSFDWKQPKLELKLVSALSVTKR